MVGKEAGQFEALVVANAARAREGLGRHGRREVTVVRACRRTRGEGMKAATEGTLGFGGASWPGRGGTRGAELR